MSDQADRVVVVGGGPNGLVCAALLARAGCEVLVAEEASRPGGAVRSSADTLPGFVHDLCAGFFPLTAASPAFRELELERAGVEWIAPEVAMTHPFADGRGISLRRGLEATARSLDAVAPGAGAGWRSVLGPLLAEERLVTRAALARFPPLRPGALLALRLGRRSVEVARLLLGSAAGFGAAVLGHDDATAWLAGTTGHSDLGPGAAGGAAFAVYLHLLGHAAGWPFPRGGAGRITDALLARLSAAGGAVRSGARVERVLTSGRRAVGVRLDGGEEIPAGAVVVATSLGPFLSLAGAGALPGRLERRLRRWRYGIGTFKLDLALSGPVPWAAADARAAGAVQIGTLPEQFQAAHEARLGLVPERPTLIVGQHSLHDPSRAPAGRHTLYCYTHVPADAGLSDEQVAERIERRIEELAPGFRELVIARATRSPRRLERENRSLVGGDLAGGSVELDQQLLFRPDPALVRYRTPVAGLYLAGASVHPGPGVHGACGAGAARAVLADRSPLRRWRRRR